MSLPLSAPPGSLRPSEPLAPFLPRFREHHDAHHALTVSVVRRLDDDAFRDCAQRLGTASTCSLVQRAQLEWPVLLDFTVYCHRVGGKSAVDRLVLENLRLTPTQARTLDAMARARVRVLEVDHVFPRSGMRVRDAMSDTSFWLVDPALADRFVAGDRMVTRLVELADFAFSTGCALPMHDASLAALHEAVADDLQPQDVRTPEQEDDFARLALRFALAGIVTG